VGQQWDICELIARCCEADTGDGATLAQDLAILMAGSCDINGELTLLHEPSMAGAVRQFGRSYQVRFGERMPAAHRRALQAIDRCRTPVLGGHVVGCSGCPVEDYAYHSCGHRSCPKCLQEDGEEWFERRQRELLPVPYFHIVFSVPNELHWIIRKHQRALYPILMRAAARTLLEIAADARYLGGTIGVMATLHTWSRTLIYHPHVHCLVPAGSVDEQGQWHAAKSRYLAPENVLARVFQAKLWAMVSAAVEGLQPPGAALHTCSEVHVDLPKHGTDAVLRYLARSLHRGPISDYRILEVTDTDVCFQYRAGDRRQWRVMRLDGHEFLRRFLQHVWPERLHKVRYYGLLSRKFQTQFEAIRQQLLAATPVTDMTPAVAARDAAPTAPRSPRWLKCPHCGGQRIILGHFAPGTSPPPLRAPSTSAISPPAQPP